MNNPVAVLQHPRIRGVETLSDAGVQLLPVVSLIEALEATHDTDAHFVPYCVLGEDGVEREIPRCNKAVLQEVVSRGGQICYTAFVYDWDTPGHREVTEDDLGEALRLLDQMPDDLWGGLTAFYTTRHGFRLVFALHEPIPVAVGEGYHRAVMSRLRSNGIQVDEACSDWTRLYRLPRVLRDGEATDPFMFIEPDRGFSMNELPQVLSSPSLPREIVAAPAIAAPMPDPEDRDLLRSGRGQSDWFKAAKKAIAGQWYADAVLNERPFASVGGRDNALTKAVGHAVGHLVSLVEGTTPEHVFALFVGSAMQFEPDHGTPDWASKLWDLICRFFPREKKKLEMQREEEERARQEEEQVVLSVSHKLLAGLREWCNDKELSEPEPEEYILRRIFLQHGTHYYMLRSNGRYDSHPVRRDNLIASIRSDDEMNIIVPTRTVKNGEVVDRSIQSVINDNTLANIRDVVYLPSSDPLGFVEDDILYFGSHCHNPAIRPEFDAEVDDWLKHLCGEQNYEKLISWIAWALAVEEGPICALSIIGPPSIGKKMLVRGLAENFQYEEVADHRVFSSKYCGILLRTPVVSVNEGMPPTGGFGVSHPADTFRTLVTGDGLSVEEKYRPSVTSRCPARVVFTTNNHDVLKMLARGKNLSPDDREAIRIRLLHFDAPHDAAIWLRNKGGMAFTGREGRRWVAGDGKHKSDYVVANHFRWLYEHRKEISEPGDRLLVEGNADSDLIDEIQTQGGSYPLVIETIISMLNDQQKPHGLEVRDGEIWVAAKGVLDYFRRTIASKAGGMRLSLNEVGEVLRGLSSDAEARRDRRQGSRYYNKRLWVVNKKRLYRRAVLDAYSCPVLDELMQGEEV